MKLLAKIISCGDVGGVHHNIWASLTKPKKFRPLFLLFFLIFPPLASPAESPEKDPKDEVQIKTSSPDETSVPSKVEILGEVEIPAAAQKPALKDTKTAYDVDWALPPEPRTEAVGSGHQWNSFIDRTRDPNSVLPLPPADEIMDQLKAFLEYAEDLYYSYRRQCEDTGDEFLAAVRRGKIFWVMSDSSQKRAPFEPSADQERSVGDTTKARFEMTLIEEVVLEEREDGEIQKKIVKRVGVKYAPKDEISGGSRPKGDQGTRVVFLNVDHPANNNVSRIDINGSAPDVYLARIGINTKRNVLVLSMNGDNVEEGIYHHRPSIQQDGMAKYWKLYWKSKYEPIGWRNVATGVVSATVQAAMSYYAFKIFGNAEYSKPFLPALITWINVATLSTFSKTYANLVRNKNPNKEVLMRTLIGIPQSVLLGLANHADWTLMATYINILTIPLGDKVASTIYSFIPMVRNERGLTSGKRFMWESRAVAEREGVSWIRQLIQQVATAIGTNPNSQFKYLGNLIVWASAIPAGYIDLWYAKMKSKEYPKMLEDAERLKNWASPKNNLKKFSSATKNVCTSLLGRLSQGLGNQYINTSP